MTNKRVKNGQKWSEMLTLLKMSLLPSMAARYVLIQYQYNINTISMQYRYDTIQYHTQSTQKLPKITENTRKFQKDTQEYTNAP